MELKSGLFLISFLMFISISFVQSNSLSKSDWNLTNPNESVRTESSLSPDDSTIAGVKHIAELLENLNLVSSEQLQTYDEIINGNGSASITDQTVIRHGRSVTSRLFSDPEYKEIQCDFQCFLRPMGKVDDPAKVRNIAPYLSDDQINLLDCSSNLSSSLSNQSGFHMVPVQCITHFTARLVHIVLNNNENKNQGELLSEKITFVASNLGPFIREHIITHWKPFTDLYLTINIPLFGIDRTDIEPLTPWLRYLALDGIMLRFGDVMFISNLSLNYFILQGCNLYEESVNDPTKISLPDSEIANLQLSCLVLWRFACPNLPNLILMADQTAHSRLCNQNIHLVTTPSSVVPKSRFNLRLRRSSMTGRSLTPKLMSNNNNNNINNFANQLDSPMNIYQPLNQIASTIDKCLQKIEQNCRDDIYWYRTIFCVLLGVLLFMVLFSMGTVIVVCYLLKQISIQRETKIR